MRAWICPAIGGVDVMVKHVLWSCSCGTRVGEAFPALSDRTTRECCNAHGRGSKCERER